MKVKWMLVSLSAAGFILLALMLSSTAQAQEPTPQNDANCVACHEHEYYLYDSGKWFCLCEAPMHCVYCHGGRTDTMDKTISHTGLVLYPTSNHAQRCQYCHPADYTERVVTFASVAGISNTPQPLITATPAQASLVQQVESLPPGLSRLSRLEPWRLGLLAILLTIMLALVIFGYRCWKADCLLKPQS
jgi:hypothetical protein